MRKASVIFVSLLMVLVLSSAATAQLGSKGIKLGLNMANFSGDVEDTKMKMGFAAGIFVNLSLMDFIELQPEAYFTMKGAKFEGVTEDTESKYNYIEVPVLVKYNFTVPGNVKPNMFVGPAVAFLMSAKNEDTDVKDNVKSMDLGAVIGAGASVGLGMQSLNFDIRYTLGLANTVDVDGSDASVKNSVISFMVGVGF